MRTLLDVIARLAVAAWIAAAATGFLILSLPEATKWPLVAGDAWLTSPAFAENWRPDPKEVSAQIREGRESRFFRSWSLAGPSAGTLRSRPFDAPEYIAVPYAGYPDERDVGLWIECIGSGERIAISRGNAHETWVERTIRLGAGWCRSQAQLVAVSSSHDWIAVGTPHGTGAVAWLKNSVFVLATVHALAWILVLGPGFLAVVVFKVRTPDLALIVAISAAVGIGYAQFFVAYYVPQVTAIVAGVTWLAAIAGSVMFVRAWRLGTLPSTISVPVAATALLSAFYVALLYAGDVGAGSYDATYRFDPAIWSTDNQLPQIVSEALYHGRSLKGLLGAWHVSDRPPLMSGFFLLARPAWQVLLAPGDNLRWAYLFYQISGIVLSTLWVIPLWILLGFTGLEPRRRLIVVVFAAMLGPMVFNSTYIWPKMLAATLALAGCLLLGRRRGEGSNSGRLTAAAGGGLIALAMMAHSGVAFGLPMPVLLALARRGKGGVAAALVSGMTLVLVVLPWVAWQRTEDPPGNALTKFALAGTYGVYEPEIGILETIESAYASVSFREWIEMRATAAQTLIGGHTEYGVDWIYDRQMDELGRERIDDTLNLAQSLRVANIGWILFAAALFVPHFGAIRSSWRTHAGWALSGLSGVILCVVVVWSIHVTPALSYLSVLLLVAGLSAAVVGAPSWVSAAALTAQSLYFLIVWVWSPLRDANVAEGALAACVMTAGVLAIVVARASPRADS